MTTIGRWSPNKVRAKIIDAAWVSETRYAMELVRPSSVTAAGAGSSASIVGLGSVDFSTCTSVRLDGVFSAEYDNYMVVCDHVDSTYNAAFLTRLVASGTPASGSDYTFQRLDAASTTVAASRSTSQTSGRVSSVSNSLNNGFVVYVYGPYLAQPTAYRSVTVENGGSPGVVGILDYAGTHSLSTAYDGYQLIAGSGTIGGSVAVYGLRG